MQTLERAPANQNLVLDHEHRIKTDTETWLAETLHGSMQTSFEFGYDGQFIRGDDGGRLDAIFDDSISVAKEMTARSPNMIFELRRRIIERGELDDMYKMLNGELPNTMIVISDFPEELKNQKEDVGGYNTDRQQTMMRVITAKDGKLTVTTRSLDGSNRQALEAVFGAVGETAQEGEMLGQRIHRDLAESWQEKLPNILTEAYDTSLNEQTGNEYYAGIKQHPNKNMVDTYKFAQAQTDLVEWFVRQKKQDPKGAEQHRYKLAATARARHERYLAKLNCSSVAIPAEVSHAGVINMEAVVGSLPLDREMHREEQRAVTAGKVFSGCGGTVAAKDSLGELSIDDMLGDLGFGNTGGSGRGGKCKFKSKKCPECKKEDVMTTITDTHIEGECGCKVKRVKI